MNLQVILKGAGQSPPRGHWAGAGAFVEVCLGAIFEAYFVTGVMIALGNGMSVG